MAIGIRAGRNRAKDFARATETNVQDFDPESENLHANQSDDDDDDESASDEENEFDGREHYVDVGKSALRKPKSAPLGPQYSGAKVDRAELDDEDEEDEDDPFSRGFDDDDSVDEEDKDELQESDGSSDEDAIPAARARKEDRSLREELAAVRNEDQQKSVAASISQATKIDAEKGRAVKKQRTAFDSVLNTRMKLQKSLVATNTLVGTPADQVAAEREDAQSALEAAEKAAFTLWTSLNDLRQDLLADKTNKKRKQPSFTISTPTEHLFEHLQSQEAVARPQRDATIKKWHQKTQDPTVQSQTGGRLKDTVKATIIDVLEEQLSQTDRLLKRTYAPRSCAPLQSAQRITEDPTIYDDADFYGLLLKELLEQKSADSVAASNIDVGFQMRRENRTKRNVDTKASKGRKLRYTVHEKLQNFMAPEDRSTWSERQSDELFGSLFGHKMALGEREEDGQEQDQDNVDMEEAGLIMFRS